MSQLITVQVEESPHKMFLRERLAGGKHDSGVKIEIDLIMSSATLLISIGERAFLVSSTDLAKSIFEQLVSPPAPDSMEEEIPF